MSLLLGKCHHVEVVEEGAESDDDEESCQVKNSLTQENNNLVVSRKAKQYARG